MSQPKLKPAHKKPQKISKIPSDFLNSTLSQQSQSYIYSFFQYIYSIILVPKKILSALLFGNNTKFEARVIDGTNIVFANKNCQTVLWGGGSFGKGTLSRSEPTWNQRRLMAVDLSFILESDYDGGAAKRDLFKKIDGISRKEKMQIEDQALDILKRRQEEGGESLVQQTADGDDMIEKMQLDPYEAFFLSFGLNCLIVKNDSGRILSNKELWNYFENDSAPHRFLLDAAGSNCSYRSFSINYAVYHHYRSQSWIVKSGLKYGVDFVLYKNGPLYEHSEYAVIVLPKYQSPQSEEESKESMLFTQQLMGIQRVISQVQKKLLICTIKLPNHSMNITPTQFLRNCEISDLSISRWVPEQTRA
ncbi:tRNA splicing endonuclease subunit sen2 [Nowakowskiella sp. JEL0407]|nr:tRNA splicing endonuclease subunit sen2 [Nowakowskiella sp. JEL0407]